MNTDYLDWYRDASPSIDGNGTPSFELTHLETKTFNPFFSRYQSSELLVRGAFREEAYLSSPWDDFILGVRLTREEHKPEFMYVGRIRNGGTITTKEWGRVEELKRLSEKKGFIEEINRRMIFDIEVPNLYVQGRFQPKNTSEIAKLLVILNDPLRSHKK